MQKYEEIKNLIASIDGDVDKFYNKGNKSAGTRIRKAMQDLKKLAKDLRVDVQESKSAE